MHSFSFYHNVFSAPPEKPRIYDDTGKEVRLKLGPYQIGDSVKVECVVLGGQPSPAVTWWRDHQIVDDSSEETAPGRVSNILTIPALHRSDLHSILTCQARNSNTSAVSIATSVKLDMTCKEGEDTTICSQYLFSSAQCSEPSRAAPPPVCRPGISYPVHSCGGKTCS